MFSPDFLFLRFLVFPLATFHIVNVFLLVHMLFWVRLSNAECAGVINEWMV